MPGCTRGAAGPTTLIRGARVYDRTGDVHRPPVRDVIVEGNRIASVSAADELADQKTAIAEAPAEKRPGLPSSTATASC